MQALWNRVQLNLRAICLAFRDRWLRSDDYAASYDAVAETYDDRWAVHLKAVTDRLLDHLPEVLGSQRIIDLGCGTGHAAARIAEMYPGREIEAIDISAGMLDIAERLGVPNVTWTHGDMLQAIERMEAGSASLVFSGWAIGYSVPGRLIREAARVLEENGALAFVVNYMDTMPAVFDAYRRTMRRFPQALRRSIWPRFPRDRAAVERMVRNAGFAIDFLQEGAVPIEPPMGPRIDWLLGTGVVAGFDVAMPLGEPGPVRDFFAEALEDSPLPLEHRYVMAVATRRPNAS